MLLGVLVEPLDKAFGDLPQQSGLGDGLAQMLADEPTQTTPWLNRGTQPLKYTRSARSTSSVTCPSNRSLILITTVRLSTHGWVPIDCFSMA